jgi:histidine ammonia-lyase
MRVRDAVPALDGDRPLTPDIEHLAELVREEALV